MTHQNTATIPSTQNTSKTAIPSTAKSSIPSTAKSSKSADPINKISKPINNSNKIIKICKYINNKIIKICNHINR
eukprot:UN17232